MLKKFRMILQDHSVNIFHWNIFVSAIIHTISTRNVSIHEFISAKLMFRYNSYYEFMLLIENCLVADCLSKNNNINSDKADSSAVMCQTSLAKLKKIQNWVMQRYENQFNLIFVFLIVTFSHFWLSHQSVTVEDLILLRKTQQNQQHEYKLKSKWSESYWIRWILNRDRFAIISDIISEFQLNKYHLQHLKKFVERCSKKITEVIRFCQWEKSQQHKIMRYVRAQKETKKLWKMIQNHEEEIKDKQSQNIHLKLQQYDDELSSF